MGRDRREGQRARRMNKNFQLQGVGVGENLRSPRDLGWESLLKVNVGDLNKDA